MSYFSIDERYLLGQNILRVVDRYVLWNDKRPESVLYKMFQPSDEKDCG